MGLDEIAITLDRWYQPGGARFLSWQMFKEYKCLSALLALDLPLGKVTEEQLPVWKSLRMIRQVVVEKKIGTGGQGLALVAVWWAVPLMVALLGLVLRSRASDLC